MLHLSCPDASRVDSRQRRLFHSPSHHLAYQMPPKPSFQVKLPPKQQGNNPLYPPTITSFALPGTLAERNLQRKSRQQKSNLKSFHVQKTRLVDWNLNAPSTTTSAPPSQSWTTISHGMSTSQIPLRLLDMGRTVETEEYAERVDCAQS